jgi:hypothetical protein
LRKQIRALPAGADATAHLVGSQLRGRRWFVEEHGLPFGAWPKRQGAAATKAFKTASTAVAKSAGADAAREAIIGFTDALNRLGSLETSEREDAATAVSLLAELSRAPVDRATALAWFDQTRDF